MLNSLLTPNIASLVDLLRFRAVGLFAQNGYTFQSESSDGNAEDSHLSYLSLDSKARSIAAHLQQHAVPGERALLLFPSGLDYIAAFFGCLYAGVIAVPVYPPHRTRPDLRLQAILKDAQPSIVLAPAEIFADRIALTTHNPHLQTLRWVVTDQLDESAAVWLPSNIASQAVAFLQYTSGSTGNPKGVMLTHANLLHNLSLIQRAFGHDKHSSGVIWLPPFHDMGLIGGILQALYLGVDVTLMSPVSFLQKPVRWLEAISKTRATSSGGPNFAYDLCVRKITPEQCIGLDLSSWDVAFCGAEPVRPETLTRFSEKFAPYGFRQEAFLPCYGMAESTLLISGGSKMQMPLVHTVQEQALSRNQVVQADEMQAGYQQLVSCGLIWADQKTIIVHPETRLRCAAHEVGEIWVAGKSVAPGYWNRPEETAQTFGATLADTGEGPFLRTGDLGFIQAGRLCVTGRIKDLIIIRGLNHYPQDIEATVAGCHPTLQGSFNAAFSVDISGEEKLVVVSEIERTQMRKLNMDEVVAAVRGAVSTHHALQLHALYLVRPTSLPKTTSGKVQRRATRAACLENSLNGVAEWRTDAPIAQSTQSTKPSTNQPSPPVQNATAIQTWMTHWLATKMNLPAQSIEPHKPFAEYGLDSMAAVEMAQAISDWLKPAKELKPTLAWDYPTLFALAHHLEHLEIASTGLLISPIAQKREINPSIVAGVSAKDDLSAALAQELAQLERLLD